MTLLLVTDAWHPQVNGVVRALDLTMTHLHAKGMDVELIAPDQYRTIPCPTYPEIRLAMVRYRTIAKRIDALRDRLTHVHIATEGPLGQKVRKYCRRHGLAFTTSFHTRFPDYLALRSWIHADWIWPMMARFHNGGACTMVATERLGNELSGRGFAKTHRWPLGVDTALFTHYGPSHPAFEGMARPIRLYVGRVAIEKNLEALLELPQKGITVIVGGGPDFELLSKRYPNAVFLGPKHGEELASLYRGADFFVFPSRSETFGLVMIEALACGTPVAAFPVQGPIDIIGPQDKGIHRGRRPIGALDEHLGAAIHKALRVDAADCVAEASHYAWDACTDRFVAGLVTLDGETPALAASPSSERAQRLAPRPRNRPSPIAA
ncbi:glycosyltransferase family 4 protein [Sphingomicrobium sediminis]|uniref:Glycosyltransferase family 1 protein n=1 Tax=Sphingomicrobium sediminis TaxID=2950949 RepID=A0A9X2J170_9SPHN|nr:glycosyltransferase family 1 protein [Sphingomicrobium sediminis]MCM8556419.1 glycosyltransferase family 1 protein [Sphingomicrobium sediminis]